MTLQIREKKRKNTQKKPLHFKSWNAPLLKQKSSIPQPQEVNSPSGTSALEAVAGKASQGSNQKLGNWEQLFQTRCWALYSQPPLSPWFLAHIPVSAVACPWVLRWLQTHPAQSWRGPPARLSWWDAISLIWSSMALPASCYLRVVLIWAPVPLQNEISLR